MECDACKERGKTWAGDDPRCAFKEGVFDPSNWNCATANLIRDLMATVALRYLDQSQGLIVVDVDDIKAIGLYVTWYKRRGETEQMWLMSDDNPPRRPTLKECQAILKHLQKNKE